jgi:ubiquinone biosynthesis protein
VRVTVRNTKVRPPRSARSLIPTPLVHERPAISVPRSRPGRLRPLANMLRVALFFVELALSRLFRGALRLDNARRARTTIEHLGGLWLKFGQLISLRRDILPEAYSRELASLQDRALGFDPREARIIVERELGRPIDDVFSEFEDQPIGAASIAQVHRARLRHNSRQVVVKIQRPDIRAQAEQTLRWIGHLVAVFDWLEFAPHLDWREMLTELRQTALEELDFRIEATSLRRMRKMLREDKVIVPRTYKQWTTRHLLVMEFIDGVFMSEIIAVMDQDPARLAAWEAENNVDRRRVAKRLYQSMMRQLFKRNLFHADPHPGNIIVLRDSNIALIDFGSVGFLDAEFLSTYRYFLEAIAERDYGRSADLLFLLASALPETDLASIRAEIIAKFRAWEMRAKTKGLPYDERSLTSVVSDIFLSLSRHRIALSWSFLRVDRAELTVDATFRHLAPDYDFVKLMRKSFVRINTGLLIQELEPDRMLEHAGRAILGTLRATRDLDEQVAYVQREVRQNAQVFRATTSRFADLMSSMISAGTYVLAAVTAYLVITLFWKRGAGWAGELLGPTKVTAVEFTPAASSWWWAAILLGMLLWLRSAWRLKGRFDRRSNRTRARQSDAWQTF